MILAWRAVDDELALVDRARLGLVAVASGVMLRRLHPPRRLASSATRPSRSPGAEAAGGAAGERRVRDHPPPDELAFMLWALVHIALWGSPRNLIVAGGILVLAWLGSIGQDRKKLDVLGEPVAGLDGADLVRAVRALLDRPGEMERPARGLAGGAARPAACGWPSPGSTRRKCRRSPLLTRLGVTNPVSGE